MVTTTIWVVYVVMENGERSAAIAYADQGKAIKHCNRITEERYVGDGETISSPAAVLGILAAYVSPLTVVN